MFEICTNLPEKKPIKWNVSSPRLNPLQKLKMDAKEENGSKIVSWFGDGRAVNLYLHNEEENSRDDEFIESAPIKIIKNEKNELDQKESNLCLKETSYDRETRSFNKIKVESISDRNTDKEFNNGIVEPCPIIKETNDVCEIADKKFNVSMFRNHSHENLLKSEIIEREEILIREEEYNEDMLKSQKTQKPGNQSVVHQCPECPYRTKQKNNFKTHLLKHKKCVKIDSYSCQECAYKTCRKGNLKAHAETHKSKEEKEELRKKNRTVLHRCRECPYKTYYKCSFKVHSIKHKKPDEIDWYCCQKCPYKTYQKQNLKIHAEIHNNVVLKCPKCSYETLRPTSLKRHHIKHKTNIQWLHCSECSFKTHMPCLLRTHLLGHKSDAFKCSKCSYQSRTKQQLTVHQLKHESIDKWHSCPLCPFKTYIKSKLVLHCRARHKIDPNNPKQIEIFKCTECPYESGNKASVKQHQMIHDRSNWFQCSDCGYKTARKSNLKKHILLEHQGEYGEGWHRCLKCPYKASEKSHLQQHVIIHKSADEVRWFECTQCSFKTEYKGNLRQHQLKHKKSHQIEWFYCYECGLKMKYKSSLVNHIWTHKKQDSGK